MTLTTISNADVWEIFTADTCKGLTFVYDYDLTEFVIVKEGLQKNHQIRDAVSATWIRSKVPNCQAILWKFNGRQLPQVVAIAGERAWSRVFSYRERRVICKLYQEYNHTAGRYRNNATVCGRCAQSGHNKDNCSKQVLNCYHCGEWHQVGDRRCSKQRKQEEILAIRTKKNVSIGRARLLYEKAKTTGDADILTDRKGWQRLCENQGGSMK